MTEWCAFCRQRPCLWTTYVNDVRTEVNEWIEEQVDTGELDLSTEMNRVRRFCYRSVTLMHYGVLGQDNRVRLPACFVEGIHDLFPDPYGNYMGHRDA